MRWIDTDPASGVTVEQDITPSNDYQSQALNRLKGGSRLLRIVSGFIILVSIVLHGIPVTPAMRRLEDEARRGDVNSVTRRHRC